MRAKTHTQEKTAGRQRRRGEKTRDGDVHTLQLRWLSQEAESRGANIGGSHAYLSENSHKPRQKGCRKVVKLLPEGGSNIAKRNPQRCQKRLPKGCRNVLPKRFPSGCQKLLPKRGHKFCQNDAQTMPQACHKHATSLPPVCKERHTNKKN